MRVRYFPLDGSILEFFSRGFTITLRVGRVAVAFTVAVRK